MAKFKRGSLTLARQVFNTPQLIISEDLQTIAQYLVNRANGDVIETSLEQRKDIEKEESLEVLANYTNEDEKQRYFRRLGISPDGKRGYLDVSGTLVAKAGQIDADCMELTSYEGLYNQFVKQVNEGIQELVMEVSSGGGSAFSCFEMAQQVRDLATEKNIKIYAFVDGLAASAAYAWASIADEIVARKDSELGSVGVVVQLINNSKMLENIGLTRTFVYNGSQKIPFNAEGEFSPQFLSSLQKKVDKTGLEFNTFVAKNRNMKVEDVIATQAEVFDAQQALEVGFADKIMTRKEFYDNYLPTASQSREVTILSAKTQTEEKMTDVTTDLSVEQLASDLATAKETLASTTEQLTTSQEALQLKEADLEKLAADKVELEKQLSELQSAKEALETELTNIKADALQAERKAKLESVLGSENDQVATLLTTTAGLEATAFDAIVSALEAKVEKEDKEMEELGNSNAKKATTPSFNDILAERMKAKNQ